MSKLYTFLGIYFQEIFSIFPFFLSDFFLLWGGWFSHPDCFFSFSGRSILNLFSSFYYAVPVWGNNLSRQSLAAFLIGFLGNNGLDSVNDWTLHTKLNSPVQMLQAFFIIIETGVYHSQIGMTDTIIWVNINSIS